MVNYSIIETNKTVSTLIKCILGELKPKRGVIQIFGKNIGSRECCIPGAGVGYMPQELGLVFELTIEEILNYFGKIYGMDQLEIKQKTTELLKLLNLPSNNKFIGKTFQSNDVLIEQLCLS